MIEGPTRVGWGALIAAKAVCCGVLLLFLTGVLTLNGVLGWFRDGNLAWLLLAGAGAMVGIIFWLRQRWRDRKRGSGLLRARSVRWGGTRVTASATRRFGYSLPPEVAAQSTKRSDSRRVAVADPIGMLVSFRERSFAAVCAA